MNEIVSGDAFIFIYGLIVSAIVTHTLVWGAILGSRKKARTEARASRRRGERD